MIARHKNLPAVGKLREPFIEVENSSGAIAEHREITGVDKQIARWDFDFSMQLMCIGYRHDGDAIGVLLRDRLCFSRAHRVHLNRY